MPLQLSRLRNVTALSRLFESRVVDRQIVDDVTWVDDKHLATKPPPDGVTSRLSEHNHFTHLLLFYSR